MVVLYIENRLYMSMSWHRNTFCSTGPFMRGITYNRWITLTKEKRCGAMRFSFLLAQTNCWKKSSFLWFMTPGQSCDVNVMILKAILPESSPQPSMGLPQALLEPIIQCTPFLSFASHFITPTKDPRSDIFNWLWVPRNMIYFLSRAYHFVNKESRKEGIG